MPKEIWAGDYNYGRYYSVTEKPHRQAIHKQPRTKYVRADIADELLEALEQAQEGLRCIKNDMNCIVNEDLTPGDAFEQSVLDNCIMDLKVVEAAIEKVKS